MGVESINVIIAMSIQTMKETGTYKYTSLKDSILITLISANMGLFFFCKRDQS